MFDFKKTISAGVAAVMLFSSGAALADTTDKKPSQNAEAIMTLGALGIMVGDKDTNEFRENDAIKRSEFAKVAVHALGLEDIAEANSKSTRFPDVCEGHWATGYINVASQQGLIIGDTAGNFRPDDNITYAEAMTILVRMTGFEAPALARGGFPGGYILTGTEQGLADRVTPVSGGVSRGSVAQMTFNALGIKLMEQTGFGTDIKYTVVDKTLLEDKLEVKKFSGLLTANENTGILGSSPAGKSIVKIGANEVQDGGIETDMLLGSYVKAYAKENEQTDLYELILVFADAAKNSVVTIDAENIDALTADKASYWADRENDKSVTEAEFADNAELIYNYKKDDMLNLAIPKSGTVTIIDNNSDEKYDVIIINETQNLVVDDTSAISHRITDKYGNGNLVLDPDNKTVKFTLTDVDGNDVSFDSIAPWDVISYAKSRDGKFIKAVLVRDSISGTVAEKNSEKVVINGNDFEIAENFKGTINLRDEGIFCLDMHGKIAAVNKDIHHSDAYAYLMAADMTQSVNAVLEIKLFTDENKAVTLQGADTIKLDGKSGLKAKEVFDALGGASLSPQIITYKTNAEGKIFEITRASDKTGSTLQSYEGIFAKNAELQDVAYKASSNKLGGIALDENTIVFDIPEGVTDEAKFAIRDYKMFEDGSKYDISVYDLTEDMKASVVVVKNADGLATVSAPIVVVDKITEATGKDGNSVLKLYGYSGGKPFEAVAAEGVTLEKAKNTRIQCGDIIQYKTNLSGEIDSIRVLLDINNKLTEFKTELSDDVTVMYGKVVKPFAGSVNFTVSDSVPENFKISDATVYRYDSTKTQNRISIIDTADIQKYDSAVPERVFMLLEDGVAREIVTIK